MSFDVPHEEKIRLLRRTKLLALAGALDDIGLRARITEYYLRPTVLRYWDPHRQGVTKLVSCEPSTRWEFRYHPSGELLAVAEDVMEPDHALDAARVLAAALEVRGIVAGPPHVLGGDREGAS